MHHPIWMVHGIFFGLKRKIILNKLKRGLVPHKNTSPPSQQLRGEVYETINLLNRLMAVLSLLLLKYPMHF